MSYLVNATNATIHVAKVDPTLIFGPQRDSLYIVIPVTIVYVIIFVLGLLGNIFTCTVIIRNKSMHTATNYYLFSLAISDLLLLVSGMPQEMYSIWSKWPYVFGPSFCLIRGLAAETSTNASVLTITLFTIERYLAICHPFVSHKMSKLSRATKHVLMLWVAALALALPQALQFGIREHRGVVMCLQTRVIIEHSFEISTFFFFFAPMLVIVVLYSLIGLRLKKASISKDSQDEKDFERSMRFTHKVRRRHGQSTRRVVKMLVAVVIAFFICWAPFHAQRLVAIYGTGENHRARSNMLLFVYSVLTYVSGIFYYLSTCINPILYHIMSNKFRDAFKNTMLRCCGLAKRSAAQRSSYTAMALARNPTSSGTDNSGNSVRNEATSNYNKTRQDIKEKRNNMKTDQIHSVCKNCNKILEHSERWEGNYPFKYTTQRSFKSLSSLEVKKDDLLKYDTNSRYTSQAHVCNRCSGSYNKGNYDFCNQYCRHQLNRNIKSADMKDETRDCPREYYSDEPEIYIKEINQRIMQREKEYG